MNARRKPRSRRLLVRTAGLALLLMAGAYGFTAANTVPESRAGDGTGTVSGYTVSAIHYTLDTPPTKVKTLTFNLDSAPISGSTLQVQVGGNWYACTVAVQAVTCNTTVGTELTVAGTSSIEAIVAD